MPVIWPIMIVFDGPCKRKKLTLLWSFVSDNVVAAKHTFMGSHNVIKLQKILGCGFDPPPLGLAFHLN